MQGSLARLGARFHRLDIMWLCRHITIRSVSVGDKISINVCLRNDKISLNAYLSAIYSEMIGRIDDISMASDVRDQIRPFADVDLLSKIADVRFNGI
jgi:hypothetical protein